MNEISMVSRSVATLSQLVLPLPTSERFRNFIVVLPHSGRSKVTVGSIHRAEINCCLTYNILNTSASSADIVLYH
jgi:hypothetical protein